MRPAQIRPSKKRSSSPNPAKQGGHWAYQLGWVWGNQDRGARSVESLWKNAKAHVLKSARGLFEAGIAGGSKAPVGTPPPTELSVAGAEAKAEAEPKPEAEQAVATAPEPEPEPTAEPAPDQHWLYGSIDPLDETKLPKGYLELQERSDQKYEFQVLYPKPLSDAEIRTNRLTYIIEPEGPRGPAELREYGQKVADNFERARSTSKWLVAYYAGESELKDAEGQAEKSLLFDTNIAIEDSPGITGPARLAAAVSSAITYGVMLVPMSEIEAALVPDANTEEERWQEYAAKRIFDSMIEASNPNKDQNAALHYIAEEENMGLDPDTGDLFEQGYEPAVDNTSEANQGVWWVKTPSGKFLIYNYQARAWLIVPSLQSYLSQFPGRFRQITFWESERVEAAPWTSPEKFDLSRRRTRVLPRAQLLQQRHPKHYCPFTVGRETALEGKPEKDILQRIHESHYPDFDAFEQAFLEARQGFGQARRELALRGDIKVYYTDAPPEYDNFGTFEIDRGHGLTRKGKEVRRVAIAQDRVNLQLPRYGSGLNFSVDEQNWAANRDLFLEKGDMPALAPPIKSPEPSEPDEAPEPTLELHIRELPSDTEIKPPGYLSLWDGHLATVYQDEFRPETMETLYVVRYALSASNKKQMLLSDFGYAIGGSLSEARSAYGERFFIVDPPGTYQRRQLHIVLGLLRHYWVATDPKTLGPWETKALITHLATQGYFNASEYHKLGKEVWAKIFRKGYEEAHKSLDDNKSNDLANFVDREVDVDSSDKKLLEVAWRAIPGVFATTKNEKIKFVVDNPNYTPAPPLQPPSTVPAGYILYGRMGPHNFPSGWEEHISHPEFKWGALAFAEPLDHNVMTRYNLKRILTPGEVEKIKGVLAGGPDEANRAPHDLGIPDLHLLIRYAWAQVKAAGGTQEWLRLYQHDPLVAARVYDSASPPNTIHATASQILSWMAEGLMRSGVHPLPDGAFRYLKPGYEEMPPNVWDPENRRTPPVPVPYSDAKVTSEGVEVTYPYPLAYFQQYYSGLYYLFPDSQALQQWVKRDLIPKLFQEPTKYDRDHLRLPTAAEQEARWLKDEADPDSRTELLARLQDELSSYMVKVSDETVARLVKSAISTR